MISKESEECKELLEKIEERKTLINNEVEFNKLSEEERVKTTEFLKLSERMAGVIENTKSASNTKQEQVMWTSKLRSLIPNYVQEVNDAIFFDGEKGIFKTYNTFDIFGASSVNYPQAGIIQPEDFLLPYISGVVLKINGELRQFDVVGSNTQLINTAHKSTEFELQELRNNINTLRSLFNKQLVLMENYVSVLEKRLEKYRK